MDENLHSTPKQRVQRRATLARFNSQIAIGPVADALATSNGAVAPFPDEVEDTLTRAHVLGERLETGLYFSPKIGFWAPEPGALPGYGVRSIPGYIIEYAPRPTINAAQHHSDIAAAADQDAQTAVLSARLTRIVRARAALAARTAAQPASA